MTHSLAGPIQSLWQKAPHFLQVIIPFRLHSQSVFDSLVLVVSFKTNDVTLELESFPGELTTIVLLADWVTVVFSLFSVFAWALLPTCITWAGGLATEPIKWDETIWFPAGFKITWCLLEPFSPGMIAVPALAKKFTCSLGIWKIISFCPVLFDFCKVSSIDPESIPTLADLTKVPDTAGAVFCWTIFCVGGALAARCCVVLSKLLTVPAADLINCCKRFCWAAAAADDTT